MKEKENTTGHAFERTQLLLGDEGIRRLNHATICIFGIGGVGGYVTEALARCGVGHFVLIDHDTVSESNLNRQIIALRSTINRPKVEVMKERIVEINPAAEVEIHQTFYLPQNEPLFDFSRFSYVVDCVDCVTAKIDIVLKAQAAGVPVISSMGTGNKLNPSALEIADIYKTSVCPLAKVMRRELKKRGVKKLKVVYSKENPIKAFALPEEGSRRRGTPGSISFVPSSAGLLLASEVVKDLTTKVAL